MADAAFQLAERQWRAIIGLTEGPRLEPIRTAADLSRLRPNASRPKFARVFETVARLKQDLPHETSHSHCAEKADASRAAVAVNSRVGRHGRITSVSGSDQDESLGPAPYL
jgi:hypothetical protein